MIHASLDYSRPLHTVCVIELSRSAQPVRLYWIECRLEIARSGVRSATALDIAAVQAALRADGLDGWLLYDFRGLNPIAAELTARESSGRTPRDAALVLPDSGDRRAARAGARHRAELAGASAGHDRAVRRPRPARSRARDAAAGLRPRGHGVLAQLRDSVRLARRCRHGRAGAPAGVDVVSSGDLIQRFCAVWDRDGASRRIAKRRRNCTASRIARSTRSRDGLRDGVPTTEYDIQQLMAGWFRDEGLSAIRIPNVSAAENAGNPHYLPTAAVASRRFGRRARAARSLGQARSPRRGLCRHHLDGLHGRASARAVRPGVRGGRGGARRRGRARPARRVAAGQELRGWQVDRAASSVLRSAGYGDHILHRTGPQPRRIGARQRRQHGRLRDARRSAPAAPAPASRSSRASTSTISACGRKST